MTGKEHTDQPTAADYAAEIVSEIRKDQAAGLVPADVTTFVELHDYVDANDYLSGAGVPFGTDPAAGEDGCEMVNAVCAEVSHRLADLTGPL
jgi:hypothetical protein